jgi:Flp pilus assembly protein TadD
MHRRKNILRGLLAACLLAGCSPFMNDHAHGLSLLQAGRQAEAWQAFEKGYNKDPLSPFSLNNMGYVFEMRDQKLSKAATFYRRAIAACQKLQKNKEIERLEKKAHENLTRVLWKIQNTPRWHVNARGLKIPIRKS